MIFGTRCYRRILADALNLLLQGVAHFIDPVWKEQSQRILREASLLITCRKQSQAFVGWAVCDWTLENGQDAQTHRRQDRLRWASETVESLVGEDVGVTVTPAGMHTQSTIAATTRQ